MIAHAGVLRGGLAFCNDSGFDTFKVEKHPLNVEDHCPGKDPPGYSHEHTHCATLGTFENAKIEDMEPCSNRQIFKSEDSWYTFYLGISFRSKFWGNEECIMNSLL